jgi:hypothetical protein
MNMLMSVCSTGAVTSSSLDGGRSPLMARSMMFAAYSRMTRISRAIMRSDPMLSSRFVFQSSDGAKNRAFACSCTESNARAKGVAPPAERQPAAKMTADA